MSRYRSLSAMVLILVTLAGIGTTQAHLDPVRLWLRGYDITIGGCPHGQLNVRIDIEKLMHEEQPNLDWFYYLIKLQTVPGIRLCSNSNWETSQTAAHFDPIFSDPAAGLVDYDPTTTNSNYEVGVSASVYVQSDRVIGGQATVSYSYPVPYVKVIDSSNYNIHYGRGQAAWWHDFKESSDKFPGSPSDSTYQAKPAFVVQEPQCDGSDVLSYFRVDFGHPVWWWWEYYTYGIVPTGTGEHSSPGPRYWLEANYCGDEI